VGIQVTSAHSADDLVALLARRLSAPQADILAPDVVVVPGQGMVDWLQESLSPHMGASGIVANVHFWHPSEFTLKATGQFDHDDHSWNPAHLQWVLLEFLATHTGHGGVTAPGFSGAKRKLTYARRVAELFDRYAVHRPEMILEWVTGKNSDGLNDLPDEFSWQPKLWREIRQILGESGPEQAANHDFTSSTGHPLLARARLSLFGLESFSRAKVDMLRLLGHDRDIELFHLTPIEDAVSKMRRSEFVIHSLRRDLELSGEVRNPLLASWSRSALESAALVASVASDIAFVTATPPDTVLGSLQSNLGEDRVDEIVEEQSVLLTQSDGSIQIHRCHGATRQVEVLRDAILHILKSDPSMSPRDVLVLCPDLERFGPIIKPVMSARLGDDSSRLRVEVVDCSNSTASPVAVSIDAILGLAGGRCSSLEVLEALSLEPVRHRFDISDDELTAIGDWVKSLNVRWGLDATQRVEWGYPANFEEGSWRWAIDRLTAGILVQSVEAVPVSPGVSPFDDVSGTDIATIGKLHEFHAALTALQQSASGEHTLSEWVGVVQQVCDVFIAAEGEGSDHLLDVRGVFAELKRNSVSAPTAKFGLNEMRSFISAAIPSIRGRAMKWADVVRVGSPSRFRGVPARVVAILGLDEDAFRGGRTGGDDILARDPWVGERDSRADERLGLLTTIHAARDHLVITCDGHDVNDNSEIPMPVLLEEFKDAVVHAISQIPANHRGSKPLVINHSRQAADKVNLGLTSTDNKKNVTSFVDGAWSFDPAIASVLQSASTKALAKGGDDEFGVPLLPEPSEDEAKTEFAINQLVTAMRRPTEVFVSQRLGVLMPADDAVEDPEFPLWPNSLDYGGLGRELLEEQAAGGQASDWWARRQLVGGLPIGPMADAVVAKLESEVGSILQAASPFLAGQPTPVEFTQQLATSDDPDAANLTIQGRVEVRDGVLLSLSFSKWHPRLRLHPWIELAAVTLHDPAVSLRAVIVARNDEAAKKSKGAPPEPTKVVEFRLAGDSREERRAAALQVLRLAARVRLTADRVPIPLFERSSWGHKNSKSKIETDLGYDLDRPAHRLVYGDAQLADFKESAPLDGIDLSTQGESRFDAYAGLLTSTWEATVVMITAESTTDEGDS
jgi:exodeoxyribonuclease V gamma subunit